MADLTFELFNLEAAQPDMVASHWRCPLVCRLLRSKDYRDGEQGIEDSYRDTTLAVTDGRTVVRWSDLESEFSKTMKSYQDPVLTEHATLALACILVSHRAGLRMTEITRRGERADYWLGNRELLLEVSGQKTGNLAALLKDKSEQLHENPFGKPGYVCVANYSDRKAFLWYFASEE